MLYSRSSSWKRGSPAAILLVGCVLASVGCGRAESPFAPDFGVEEPPRQAAAEEPPAAVQPSAPATDVSSPPVSEAAESTVMPADGQSGETEPVTLRGPTSISTGSRSILPLIVIDGVMQPEDAYLSDIESLDIEHVEIVKGAYAMRLYGPRARHSVIDIRTKRGN